MEGERGAFGTPKLVLGERLLQAGLAEHVLALSPDWLPQDSSTEGAEKLWIHWILKSLYFKSHFAACKKGGGAHIQ